jgi:hypothetical protein
MPEIISKDAVIRESKAAANQLKIQLEDEASKGLNSAVNSIMQQAINALPPPLNFGANAATKGLYAALKSTGAVNAAKNPSEIQDPIKTIAFAIAFAIIRAIWCFIKSLLNPIPIVGSFFPLCSEDPDATPDTRSDSENRAASNAESIKSNVDNDAAISYQNKLREAGERANDLIKDDLPEPVLGPQGMTFDEYLATIPTQQTNPSIQTLVNAPPPSNNTANVPVAGQNADWEGTNRDPNELRRLFGL